jgi:hypothetical protein
MDQVKKSDLVIFIVGIMIFGLLLLIPDLPDSMIYVSTVRASIQALKGQSDPSDLAQDVIGFRALVRQQNPYPVLGLAVQELDIEWDVKHLSAHPPTVFLFVAPIAFLPWGLAAMLWAWAMLGLLGCTFRLYGMSWPAAWGWTCIAFLWPPILTSLGQVTIIWLLGWTIGCLYARRHFWVNVDQTRSDFDGSLFHSEQEARACALGGVVGVGYCFSDLDAVVAASTISIRCYQSLKFDGDDPAR